MAEEIKLDENVTIRDAFKITGRENQIGTIEKNLKKAGLSMDSPFSIFQDENTSIKLAEAVKGPEGKSGNANFTTLGSVESDLKPIYRRRTGTPYPFEKVFGADGFLQESPDLMKKYSPQFKQPRRTRGFKEIPKGEISLKNIAQGISEIPDSDVRAAVAFQSLIPLRPGEVAQLDASDIDFTTGRISDEYRRVNKIRNPVELPEIALSILKSQQAKNGDDLFKGVTTNKMSSAVKKYVAPKFEEYQKAMGRKIIGASDIRKIVPSIIVGQLGYDKEAGAILGHTKYDDVLGELTKTTRKHYVSKIMDDVGSSPKIALMSLQNMYGEVLGLDTLNELAGEFNLDLPDLTNDKSPRLIVVPKEQDIASNIRIDGTLTDRDLDLLEDRRAARKAELTAKAKVAEKTGLEAELETLKLKPQILEEKRKSVDADIDFEIEKADLKKQKKKEKLDAQNKLDFEESQKQHQETKDQLKQKLGNTKMFGKFLKAAGPFAGPLGIGVSMYAADVRAEEEGKSPFEKTLFTASEVLPISAYDIEDLGKFTAEAREVGIPKALGLDTEKQEQMNIQRKERLARRSERVSSANKSSLDDQINQLLSGR